MLDDMVPDNDRDVCDVREIVIGILFVSDNIITYGNYKHRWR